MATAVNDLEKPIVSIANDRLEAAGFLGSGKTEFKNTLQSFSDELFLSSVKFSDIDNSDDIREITRDHVKNANKKIFGTKLNYGKNGLYITLNIAEYIFVLLVGIGASNFNCSWGIFMSLSSLILASASFIYRSLIIK